MPSFLGCNADKKVLRLFFIGERVKMKIEASSLFLNYVGNSCRFDIRSRVYRHCS